MTASATARIIHGRGWMFWKIQGIAWTAFAGLIVLLYAPARMSLAAAETFLLKVACAALASLVLRFVCRFVWRRRQAFVLLASAALVCAGVLGICVEWGVDELTRGIWNVPDAITIHAIVTASLRYQFVLTAWCVGYFTIKFFVQSQQRLQLVRAAERQKKEAMLAGYRYQLPRRFLTDTLTEISYVIQAQDASYGSQMIAHFANLLRSMLQDPDAHVAPLREELDLLNRYLSLLKECGHSELMLTLNMEEALKEELIPRWLLIPVVDEYARIPEHGMIATWNLALSVRRQGDMLVLHIQMSNSTREHLASRDAGEFYFLKSLLDLTYDGRASFEIIGNGELVIRLPHGRSSLE